MIWLLFAMQLLCDSLSFTCAREILRDFLFNAKSRRQVKDIEKGLSLASRLWLGYIKPNITTQKKAFSLYNCGYHIFLCATVPKYLLCVLCVLIGSKEVSYAILMLSDLISFATFLFFRLPQLPDGVTKYVNKKHRRNNTQGLL